MAPGELLGIPFPSETTGEESLLTLLTGRVLELLQNDPRGLTAALYRIDVGEAIVSKALEGKDRQKAARELAMAILERENRRRVSRLKSKKDRLTQ